MHSTNYTDTFITVAPDSRAEAGVAPAAAPEKPTVAALTFALIQRNPYRFTSDDVIFAVYAERKQIPEAQRAAARAEFFSKGQPCLRASDLGKRYGWGIHHDSEARVALYGVETTAYHAFASGNVRTAQGDPVAIKAAMRSARS